MIFAARESTELTKLSELGFPLDRDTFDVDDDAPAGLVRCRAWSTFASSIDTSEALMFATWLLMLTRGDADFLVNTNSATICDEEGGVGARVSEATSSGRPTIASQRIKESTEQGIKGSMESAWQALH